MANYKDPLLNKLDDLMQAAIAMQVERHSPPADKLVKLAMECFDLLNEAEPWRAVGQTQQEYMAAMADDSDDD